METKALNEKYYTVKEAAEILKVSPMTIYRAIELSQISVLRIGRTIRIPESAFDEFLHPAKPPKPDSRQWRPPVTRL